MRKEMDGQDGKERYTSPEVEKLEAFTDGFVEGIARRHGVPEDNPGKVKDVLEAASQVSFENLPEDKLPKGLPGKFIEAAVRVETVAQNLPLSPKQREFAKGLEENFKGAAGFFSAIGEKAKELFPKEKGKIAQKAATSLLVAQMALSACSPVVSPQTPEAAFTQTPVPAETFTPTPTETLPTPTAIPTEIPDDQIKLNENSFIPTGEYPKNGDNLILLGDENIGESAKKVVLENGLGEQAQAIEDMYQAILDKHRLYSNRIPQGATLSFTYLVYSKDGVGNWTIIPQLNGFGVPRVVYPVLYDKSIVKNQYLSQSEILNIAISRTYPKNIWPVETAMPPVGFGKEIKPSYYTDENGNFVVGILDKKSNKPLIWYNIRKEAWQIGISENVTNENTYLQENMDLWMNGNITISDDEKFKADDNVAPLNLTYNSEEDGVSIYQGVVLGTEQFDGNLIVYFGFEDNNQRRFYMPISLGSVNSDSALFALTRQVHRLVGFGSNYDVESRFTISSGEEVFSHIDKKVVNLSAIRDILQMECQNETNVEIKNLCNEQVAITEKLPELFDAIANYGPDGVKNLLINGSLGKNGLGLSDVPLINCFRIFSKNEP